MKWVRFDHAGTPRFGFLEGDTVISTSLAWDEIVEGRSPDSGEQFDLGSIRRLAPLERPGKVVAIGLNYMDHIRETGSALPKVPLIFTKFTTAINNPGGTIRWSKSLTEQVDYEAELAVIIGKTTRKAAEADALSHVFGYTAANDVSARDLQFGDGQWVRAKSLDTFCPLGPLLVTADEIPDPQKLVIRTELNGRTVQDSNTSEMIFKVAHLISFCSHSFTLEPGDVILTGTPHGVGSGRDPKLFMQDGDSVVVEIEGIGRLENDCAVE